MNILKGGSHCIGIVEHLCIGGVIFSPAPYLVGYCRLLSLAEHRDVPDQHCALVGHGLTFWLLCELQTNEVLGEEVLDNQVRHRLVPSVLVKDTNIVLTDAGSCSMDFPMENFLNTCWVMMEGIPALASA